MSRLYPLRFAPIFRRYLWGGRRLESILGKTLGEGDDYAESWEIVDHGEDQSIVSHGDLRGRSLNELVQQHGDELLGSHSGVSRFPLLFKFLDAHQSLSVQVHPNDEQAAELDPPDLGKTEAWLVLHSEPGSVIYAGLKRGVDRAVLEREVHRGTTEHCLHRIEPQVGDCIFIPAGTVHAIGSGLVIAEIQQASDTTFRLFDWNRVDAQGNPRPLHVEQSLDVIDYDRRPVMPQQPQPTGRSQALRLVRCDKFILDRWQFDHSVATSVDQRFHLLAVLEGAVTLADGQPPLRRGQTALVPASLGEINLKPDGVCVLLDMYLP